MLKYFYDYEQQKSALHYERRYGLDTKCVYDEENGV